MQPHNNKIYVRIAGSGSFLPGAPVPASEVDYYLGELSAAPEKIRKWLRRIRVLMKEMLEIEYYHFASIPLQGNLPKIM